MSNECIFVGAILGKFYSKYFEKWWCHGTTGTTANATTEIVTAHIKPDCINIKAFPTFFLDYYY